MLTRRLFLLGALNLSLTSIYPALARHRITGLHATGLRCLAKQEWPPSILPNRVDFLRNGYACLTDETGRLIIVDFSSGNFKVVGQLFGLGKRLIDFRIVNHRGYGLVLNDSPTGEPILSLITVNLEPHAEPSIMSQINLESFVEASCLAASTTLVCVAGISSKGTNQVAIFNPTSKRRHNLEPSLISTLPTESPIVAMGFAGWQLCLLKSGSNSGFETIEFHDGQSFPIRKSILLDGHYSVMSQQGYAVLIAGENPEGWQAKLINLEPAPHVVCSLDLGSLYAVNSVAPYKGHFLLLASQADSRVVFCISTSKDLRLAQEELLKLPATNAANPQSSSIACKERVSCVVSGDNHIDILSLEKQSWKVLYQHSIPTLAASGIATWDNLVVTGAADLSLYNISNPSKPVLVSYARPEGTMRAITGAGSYLLCLTSRTLTLRKMDHPSDVIVSLDFSAQRLVYDRKTQRAFLLATQNGASNVIPVRVYSNRLVMEPAQPVPIESTQDSRRSTSTFPTTWST